jgi:hypothetical protein
MSGVSGKLVPDLSGRKRWRSVPHQGSHQLPSLRPPAARQVVIQPRSRATCAMLSLPSVAIQTASYFNSAVYYQGLLFLRRTLIVIFCGESLFPQLHSRLVAVSQQSKQPLTVVQSKQPLTVVQSKQPLTVVRQQQADARVGECNRAHQL